MMQALTQTVHRFSYDVFDEDSYSYVPGEAKAEMARIVQETEHVLDTLRLDLAPHLPVCFFVFLKSNLISLAYCL
jgi:hypothetical protein